ncbi:MAG: YrhK family protein [Nitrococcus sp.]|nr:YrhK family protein [Nitrococcus sp.]
MTQASKQELEDGTTNLTLFLGRYRFAIWHPYHALSILNDFLLGFLFLAGSVCFLFNPLYWAGVWCFVVGSALFVARPTIRLAHYLHVGRRKSPGEWDF